MIGILWTAIVISAVAALDVLLLKGRINSALKRWGM